MPLALSVQMCIIESRRVWHERRQISPTTTTTTTTTTTPTTTPTLQPSIFFYVKKSPRIELPKYLSHPYSCCCCCCCCTSDYKRAENYLDFIEKNELSLCAFRAEYGGGRSSHFSTRIVFYHSRGKFAHQIYLSKSHMRKGATT